VSKKYELFISMGNNTKVFFKKRCAASVVQQAGAVLAQAGR
jgi:hypothetical protein